MSSANVFAVNPGWRVLLNDLGLHPLEVLRKAGLPEDLFSRKDAVLDTAEYFRFWYALEESADDPLLPLRIGSAISVEAFDPPVFAALCSPDLNTALQRLARHKKLLCPMALHVSVTDRSTMLEIEWLDVTAEPPGSLIAVELVFFVQLARIATRQRICPLDVLAPLPLEPENNYTEYFGVPVRQAAALPKIVFSGADARQPFLTASEKMWGFFEPGLKNRLSELEDSATIAERVHAVLLELLPGGTPSIDAVSSKLFVSPRTLQRRLKQEGKSFQDLLHKTREALAKHYLKTSSLSAAEISFLLGFEEPNSFFRAFHLWTGKTPEQVRRAMQNYY
ncbi:MAG: AraC family transcriptional regulator [Chlorobiales bacterium]|nr:AraC family transcriptional regulator [Chlorobiales bacterium]